VRCSRTARWQKRCGHRILWSFRPTRVERVLVILRYETHKAMAQLGAPSLKDLTPAMVRRV
jgi:isopentenyl diphosphate isomerase/L-lactate dehydrogenase-like FMN-dependent dehydrogenase